MKNLILIPLLFIALTNVYSQSYFPKEGASWHMAKSASGSGDLFPVFSKFSVLGDTNLDSKKYYKIFSTGFISGNTNYNGAYRADSLSKKVYFIPKDSAKEMLVYDFSLKVKDTLPIWDKNAYKAVIKETDSVFCYGRLRKRQIYDMQGVSAKKIGYIIEGIGSYYLMQGPFQPYYSGRFEGNDDYVSCLTELTVRNCNSMPLGLDAEPKIHASFNLYPNPNKGVFTIQSASLPLETIEIFDQLGNNVFKKSNFTSSEFVLDLSFLKSGLYHAKSKFGYKSNFVVE